MPGQPLAALHAVCAAQQHVARCCHESASPPRRHRLRPAGLRHLGFLPAVFPPARARFADGRAVQPRRMGLRLRRPAAHPAPALEQRTGGAENATPARHAGARRTAGRQQLADVPVGRRPPAGGRLQPRLFPDAAGQRPARAGRAQGTPEPARMDFGRPRAGGAGQRNRQPRQPALGVALPRRHLRLLRAGAQAGAGRCAVRPVAGNLGHAAVVRPLGAMASAPRAPGFCRPRRVDRNPAGRRCR